MTGKKRAEEGPVEDVENTPSGPVSLDQGPVEPESDTEDMAAYVAEPGKGITMGDVAALNGVGLAPDASIVDTVTTADVFVSEGMRNDLEHYGWAVDPNTGRKVVKDQ